MFSSTDRYLLVLELNNMSKYFSVFLSDHKGNKQIGHLYVFLLLPENNHVGFPDKLPYMTWDHEIHEVIYHCMFISIPFHGPVGTIEQLSVPQKTRDVGSPRVIWQLHRSTATMCCDPGPITIHLKTIKSWRVNQPTPKRTPPPRNKVLLRDTNG